MLSMHINQSSLAQGSKHFIQIQLNSNHNIYTIPNFNRLNFKVNNFGAINSKIYIINDSQFLLMNGYNEIGEDTFNIKNINAVKVKPKGSKHRIDPLSATFGLLLTWPVAIPYMVYTLVTQSTAKRWFIKDEFSIFIYYDK